MAGLICSQAANELPNALLSYGLWFMVIRLLGSVPTFPMSLATFGGVSGVRVGYQWGVSGVRVFLPAGSPDNRLTVTADPLSGVDQKPF